MCQYVCASEQDSSHSSMAMIKQKNGMDCVKLRTSFALQSLKESMRSVMT